MNPPLSGEFVLVMASGSPSSGVVPAIFLTSTFTLRPLPALVPSQLKNRTLTGRVFPHLKMLGSWFPCVQFTGWRIPLVL